MPMVSFSMCPPSVAPRKETRRRAILLLLQTRDSHRFSGAVCRKFGDCPRVCPTASTQCSSREIEPHRRPILLLLSRSEEHTSELQSPCNLVCHLLLEKKKKDQRSATDYTSSTAPPTSSRSRMSD